MFTRVLCAFIGTTYCAYEKEKNLTEDGWALIEGEFPKS